MTELKPGMFGLSIISGKTGALVAAGQALTGDGSQYTHAFLVLDNDEIIEAMPQGARVVKFADRADDVGGIVLCDPVAARIADIKAEDSKLGYADNYGSEGYYEHIEDNLRSYIVTIARGFEGTPYSFLDYAALSLAHFGVKAERLRKFMLNKGHMICSQLVDEVYRRSGIQLFDDGRLPMDVTPGDLDHYRIAHL